MSEKLINGYFERNGSLYKINDEDLEYGKTDEGEIKSLNYYESLNKTYNHPVRGENVFKFNYGPSTGGIIETLNFQIYTYGERIISLDVIPNYKNRMIKISGQSLKTGLLKLERFNGFHSFSYSTLYCKAVESLKGIPIEEGTRVRRIILMETERIISHIFKTARLCEAASQNIANYYLLSLRERLMRILGEITGHRYLFGVNKIGGLNRSINIEPLIRKIKDVVQEYIKIKEGLFVSRIFIDRLENTCISNYEFSRGPALRSTGRKYDYRAIDPYYSDIHFEIVSSNGGDSLTRFLVFSEEIEESMKIIEQCADLKFSGEWLRSAKEFEAFGTETPSGDARMVLDIEEDRINYAYLRTPSILNMEAFARGICGNVKTDIPFAFESFGIWVSEMSDVL
ncbi:formate hydrogenlyase [Cuniculiplasma sp. SKW3]|uniref:NADH-quinone oxidoreductase subunit D-related protein n=1 Tax=Cuniculiplasma sp. SKW3 TaxID=3400170 RepID=UPI003FD0187D